MTVYVVQMPSKNSSGWSPDLANAEQFGTLSYLLPEKFDIAANMDDAIEIISNALGDFDPHTDFIVDTILGHVDPLGIALVAVVLASNHEIGHFKVLRWNRNITTSGKRFGGYYVPVRIPLY